MEYGKPRSNAWYLLPVFAGLIGGVIAYWVLRHNDPNKAKKCLYLGIILAAVGIMINLLIAVEIPDLKPNFNVHV